MARKRKRTRNPQPKKKQLNVKLIAIIAISVLLAAAAIITAVILISNKEDNSGWQTIDAPSVSGALKNSFILNYDLSDGSSKDKISDIYSEMLKLGYNLYDAGASTAHGGVATLNKYVGQPTEISDGLYNSLVMMTEKSSRIHYLGPVYEIYKKLFNVTDPTAAPALDPKKNVELAEICNSIAAFASNDAAVKIEILGDHRVQLSVSDEYRELMQNAGLTNYIDFGWMRDAFIVDLIASELKAAGYTNGTISSYSGFTRNLDTDADQDYTFGLYDKYRNNVYLASSVSYKGALTSVTYKTFAMNKIDSQYLYEYKNGDTTHGYINVSNGMPEAACDVMVFHTKNMTCAELALTTYSYYNRPTEDQRAISGLLNRGIGAIYCDGTTIISTSDEVTIFDLFTSETVNYSTLK